VLGITFVTVVDAVAEAFVTECCYYHWYYNNYYYNCFFCCCHDTYACTLPTLNMYAFKTCVTGV